MSAFGNAGRIFYEDVKAGRSTQIEHINKARQAAEALFAPKQAIGPTPACVPPDSTGTRKPRILSAKTAHGSDSEQTKVPVELEPLRPCYQVPGVRFDADQNVAEIWDDYPPGSKNVPGRRR